ncbi:MAG TPA: glycosyltransferase family 39 protein [Candidatus Saccharimonadales bacterium]|nr:glycosyltransferase family 39 protein [Candidatus Saccharimonadales bacterium]
MPDSRVPFFKKYRYQLGIGLVLALAAFMRFYQLDALPPGLHPDEAANGIDVIKIIRHHDFQPFYPDNGGREGLFFMIQAIFVSMFGYTTLALRIAPALIGTLAVGAVYLWLSSWFGKRTGLIAALIMAVNSWAVIIARDGFRAGMVALMVPLTLWLYTKAFQSSKRWWYVVAGVSLGAGFYTYTSFRLFPLAIVAGLIYLWIWRREQLREWWPGITVSVATAAIVLIPLGVYGIHNPGPLFARAGGVSFTNPGLNHGHPWETLGKDVVKTALMFNFHGDEDYRQNLGGAPELNVFVGIMFVLGLFVCATRLKRLRYFGVLAVFVAMLLPEMLSAEGIPHALRAIGALPPTMALAAIGVTYLLDSWYGVFPRNQAARGCGTIAVGALLALTTYQGYVEYFVAWANAPQTYAAYSEDTTAVANFFNTTPFTGIRYGVGGAYEYLPVQFLTYHKTSYTLVDPTQLGSVPLQPGVAKQFSILEGERQQSLTALKRRFPNGRITPHYSGFSGNELFVIYTVPAS